MSDEELPQDIEGRQGDMNDSDTSSDNSEDEENVLDTEGDDEEVLGDDEELRSDDEDHDRGDDGDEAEMEVDGNNMNRDDEEVDNEVIDIVVDEAERREIRQETLFMGIKTVGMRVPLQNNLNLRAIDHFLVTLAQTVRHSNTYEQLIDELKWIKKSFRYINVPTTKNALWDVLGRRKENLIYQLFCSKCKSEVGMGAVIIRRCPCGRCGPGLDESNIATFIHIRLRPQLLDLFKIPNIAESLRYKENRVKLREDAIEDIYDGRKYQELSEPGNFLSNPHNFSFTLWTDGIKITKSSPATTYPVILQLNELSPHSRKQNLFLAGLWVANEHPVMNSILGPITNELRDLYNRGITWRPDGGAEVISKFITTIFTADSVARPDVLRMKQYNGLYGCTFCLAPGQMEQNTWVYRAEQYEFRTNESIRNDALLAVQRRTIVNGVKGVSSLATVPEFDVVDGVVVDSCHNAFLGISKRLVVRYLTDAGEAWYIGQPQDTAAIDNRLLTIKTPTRISRQPRSILLYRMWKASEWRNWLLHYALPCLDGILPRAYLKHLETLCKAIYILNSSSITEEELNIAENLLHTFVTDYEILYGLKNMVYNVHLLTHVIQSVRNWGPLWVYSALPFEALNRKITDYIKSPCHRADQIITRFFMKKFVIVAAKQIPISEETREETCRLLKITDVHVEDMPEGHYFRGLGKGKIRYPRDEEINLVRASGRIINPRRQIHVFKKACIHGTLYKINDNKRRKICDHIVFSCQSRFFVIETIFSYTYEGQTIAGIIGKYLQNIGNAYRVPYMQRVVAVEEKRFITYNEIRSPGFMIPSTEGLAAVSLCNVWETD